MNNVNKPVIVPTLMSSRTTIWCFVLLGFFIALLLVYNRYDACREAEAELRRPVVTTVKTEKFEMPMPPGWKVWASDGDSALLKRSAGQTVPYIEIVANSSPALAYRALDENKALLLMHIHDRVSRTGLVSTNFVNGAVEVLGSDVTPVKPGLSAVKMIIDVGSHTGSAVAFYTGDTVYMIHGVAADDDESGQAEIRSFIDHLGDDAVLPDYREFFERPVIDSSAITSEIIAEMLAKNERELALWKLFASRVEQEPDAALLPAIIHFREALKAMASIRREYQLLNSEDFARYRSFLDIRKANVREWFVKLDKQMAMKDVEGACEQARFIIAHATLVDESLERRYASEKLAELVALTAE